MDELVKIIFYTACAGACIPIGGLIAKMERIRPRWLENEFRHFVIAFGGGILISAVSLVLVPEGIKYTSHAVLSVVFLLCGGFCFFVVERLLALQGKENPQLIALLLDYIPESLALGGAFAIGAKSAPLLALFIGLQNLPEGFNAYRELRFKQKLSNRRIFLYMVLLIPMGPVVAILGWVYFSHNTLLLGATMLFASGGILYLIFQDIAPQSHMRSHWAPPLGAVLGFSLGMLGNNILIGM